MAKNSQVDGKRAQLDLRNSFPVKKSISLTNEMFEAIENADIEGPDRGFSARIRYLLNKALTVPKKP